MPLAYPMKHVYFSSSRQLFELAALISDPRAPRQPVHPDTPFRQGEAAAAVTAFIALQAGKIPCNQATHATITDLALKVATLTFTRLQRVHAMVPVCA